MPTILLETLIDAPIERCFSLSLSIDAHTQSMGSSAERAVAGVTSGEIGPGESVTWQARHFGVPLRMTSLISEYERPSRFVDEQPQGPFARWWHEHRFEVSGRQTRMIDHIEFEAPFGFLGKIAERLVLERYMKRLIGQRNLWLKQRLEA